MKTISLLASVLVLPAASLLAQGQSEIDILKARIDVQERRIGQLENALIRLSGQSVQKQAPVAKPSEAPKAIPVSSQENTNLTEYAVVQGDTLTRIASRHNTSVAAIKKENALSSDALKIGQKLRIPVSAPASAKKETVQKVAEAPKKAAPVAVAGKYTVKSGDTFYGIARQYNMSESVLQAANPKAVPTRLQIGQVLVIDASAKPAQSAGVAKKAPKKASVAKKSTPKPTTKSTTKPAPKKSAVAKAPKPATSSSVPKKSSTGIRTITVHQQMTYGAFANQHGASTSQLNSLNGLNLSKSTMLAKGSELYVPKF